MLTPYPELCVDLAAQVLLKMDHFEALDDDSNPEVYRGNLVVMLLRNQFTKFDRCAGKETQT